MNKTLSREYKIGNEKVQNIFNVIKHGGTTDAIKVALEEARKLPILNQTSVWVRNRKGVAVAHVGTKGYMKKLSADFKGGVWYIDGNRVGKKKKLILEAQSNFDLIKQHNLNNDDIDKLWSKVDHRVNL